MYIKSGTSGNNLPAKIVRKSFWRNLFFLPNILVEYLGSNLHGPKIYSTWVYKVTDN